MYFSVIVPIYNTEPFLRECIDSILREPFRDYELILVDDGSTDACPIICDGYAAAHGNVTVIHKPNGGLVSARKAGVSKASGKYIIYVDSDDSIRHGFLSEGYAICEKEKPDVCTFAVRFAGSGSEITEPEYLAPGLYCGADMQRVIERIPLTADMKHLHYFLWGKIFKRELLTDMQLRIDERISMGEDVTCLVPIYLAAKSVYVSDFSAYTCRCFDGSMSRKYKPSQFDDIALGAASMLGQSDDGSYRASVYRYAAFMFFVIFAAAAEQGEKSVCRYAASVQKGIFETAFRNAAFTDITPKSKIALQLLQKKHFRTAYSFLRLCGKLKGEKTR